MNILSFELLQLDEQASTVLWSAEPKVKKRVSEGVMPVPKTLIRLWTGEETESGIKQCDIFHRVIPCRHTSSR